MQGGGGVAYQAQCRIGGADPRRIGVDLDQTAAEAELVLCRRLGTQLSADRQHDVGLLEQLLERAVIAGRAGGKRVVGWERALAHIRGSDGRVEELRQLL